MTLAHFQESRGRVTAIFGMSADRVVERNYFVQQAQAQGAVLDGFVIRYPNGRREWCDYECAHELKPVQPDLFGGAS